MKLRARCRRCDGETGRIETRGGQDCVYCEGCNAFQYNAPKTETGREVRTVASVHAGIKSKRTKIFDRVSPPRCEICGRKPPEVILNVGHLISVKAAIEQGLTDQEINSDENLAVMCEECNLGRGSEVIPLRLAIAIVMARVGRIKPKDGNGGLFENDSI